MIFKMLSVLFFLLPLLASTNPLVSTTKQPLTSTSHAPTHTLDTRLLHQACHSPPNSNRLLVTGAAGFIGMHAAIEMKRRGWAVIGLDSFDPYYNVTLKHARASHAQQHHGIHNVHGDINDRTLLHTLTDICSFTHVLHLAAQAGVRHSMNNPGAYVYSNIAGLTTLLEAMKNQRPAPSLVFASTSSVYGLNPKLPFTETDAVDRPASFYAASKRAGELLIHSYHHLYSLDSTLLRFFTVYGPFGRPDMLVYKATERLLQHQPVTIYTSLQGEAFQRDFTYISDAVSGIAAALETTKPSLIGSAQYRIYNIGSGSKTSVSTLVSLLNEKIHGVERSESSIKARFPDPNPSSSKQKTSRSKGSRGLSMDTLSSSSSPHSSSSSSLSTPSSSRVKVVEIPIVPLGDVVATLANVSKAGRELGYQPKVTLEQGLLHFLHWYQEYHTTGAGAPP